MRRQRRRQYSSSQTNDMIRGYPFIIDCIIGLLIISVTMLSLIASLDPFRFVFEEFLPHPYFRSIEIIVGSWLARLILCIMCCCEFFRFIIFLAILLAAGTLTAISLVKIMLALPGNICIPVYFQSRVLIASVFGVASTLVGVLTLVMHFSTIFLFWGGIMCWDYVPHLVCATLLGLGITFISYHTIILTFIGRAPELTESIIRHNMAQNFSRRHNKLNQRYYTFLVWRAQQPIGLPCGSFFKVERSFTMAYLRELANNLVDTMLLIQPQVT